MPRKTLVASSFALHAGIGAALFITSIWKIDRLEAGRIPTSLSIAPSAPAPEGGPIAGQVAAIVPKHREHRPEALVQPKLAPEAATPDLATSATTGTGGGSGDAEGPGTGDGPPDSDGTCEGPDCGSGSGTSVVATRPPEPVAPPKPMIVAPTLLAALRISGDTQIFPSDVTKTAMMREGKPRVTGTLQICLAASGAISSVTVRASTKYPDFDQRLVTAARAWRYQPFTVNGKPAPVCAMTTFVYTIRS